MSKLNEQSNFNPEQLCWENAGAAAAQAVYQMRRVDDAGEMLECATLDALMETLIDDGATFDGATFDALVVTNAKIEAKAKQLGAAFNRAGAAITVAENGVTVTKPFKKNGSTQICMMFEMTDGQTITVFLHNPDAKPNTLQASDVLISWKWLLNRKDITIVVAKEHGKDLAVAQVAARVMALVDKNAGRFAKANAGRAARMGAIAALEGEVAAHEATLKGLIEQINAKKDGKTGGEDKTAFGSFEPELFAYAAKAGLVVEKGQTFNVGAQRYRIRRDGVDIGYASVNGINAEALSRGLFTVGSFANNAHGAIAVIDKLLALGVAVSDVDGYVNDMAKQARENGFDKLAQLFESDAIYSTYPFDSLAAIAVDPLKTNNDFTTEATKMFKGALESSHNANIINKILVARFGVTKSTTADESLSWKSIPFETTINELNSEYGTNNDFWEMGIEQARSLPDALAKRMIDALTNANYHHEALLLELKHGGFADAVQLLQSNDAYSNHPFKTMFYAAMSGKAALDKRVASIKDLDAGEIAQIQEIYAAFGLSAVPESAPIVLTGKELGDFDTSTPEGKKALRAALKDYLMAMQGDSVDCPILGDKVMIEKRGIKETLAFTGNPIKMKALYAIKDLIKTARSKDKQANFKADKKGNTQAYFHLKNSVSIDGVDVSVDLIVEQTADGHYHYDMLVEKTKATLDSVAPVLSPPTPDNYSGSNEIAPIKPQTADDVNATFDAATGKMVLNLFLQIKDPVTGEWVDLPDEDEEEEPEPALSFSLGDMVTSKGEGNNYIIFAKRTSAGTPLEADYFGISENIYATVPKALAGGAISSTTEYQPTDVRSQVDAEKAYGEYVNTIDKYTAKRKAESGNLDLTFDLMDKNMFLKALGVSSVAESKAAVEPQIAGGDGEGDENTHVQAMIAKANSNGFTDLAAFFEQDAAHCLYPFDTLAQIAVDPNKSKEDYLAEAAKVANVMRQTSENADIINDMMVARFGKGNAASEATQTAPQNEDVAFPASQVFERLKEKGIPQNSSDWEYNDVAKYLRGFSNYASILDSEKYEFEMQVPKDGVFITVYGKRPKGVSLLNFRNQSESFIQAVLAAIAARNTAPETSLAKTLKDLTDNETYQKILKDSMGGIMFNVADKGKYDVSELLAIWNAIPLREQEAAGGTVNGVMEFVLDGYVHVPQGDEANPVPDADVVKIRDAVDYLRKNYFGGKSDGVVIASEDGTYFKTVNNNKQSITRAVSELGRSHGGSRSFYADTSLSSNYAAGQTLEELGVRVDRSDPKDFVPSWLKVGDVYNMRANGNRVVPAEIQSFGGLLMGKDEPIVNLSSGHTGYNYPLSDFKKRLEGGEFKELEGSLSDFETKKELFSLYVNSKGNEVLSVTKYTTYEGEVSYSIKSSSGSGGTYTYETAKAAVVREKEYVSSMKLKSGHDFLSPNSVDPDVEVQKATDTPVEQAGSNNDQAFLQSIIDGKQSEAMASPDFADKLTDMYARVQGVEADLALFNSALQVYTDFVLEDTK